MRARNLAVAGSAFLLLALGATLFVGRLADAAGREGDREIRHLIEGLSHASTQDDVRRAVGSSRRLRFTDTGDPHALYVRVRHWSGPLADGFALVRFTPRETAFYVETGHADAGEAIDGVPLKRCLVPEVECRRALSLRP